MSKLIGKAKEFIVDKVAHVEKPEADLGDVSVKDFSRESVNFHGELSITNPYDHSIPICDIAYTLKSAGREIVSGSIPDPGSLKKNEITKMDVPMKVPYDFLISVMKDVGRDWDIDYELYVGLTIDLPVVGNFTLPVNKKGQMKLPTLSDLF
uniref:Late embryogenesis abundant protein lea14-a n=1 Tax=Allium sativum TaxID=4682 RepID=H2CLX2_ALLSA|nr:late embryogenesis abundant protein lea14-a [Allium sativum]